MRKYYDAGGNVTGTSKGFQGGCAATLSVLAALFILATVIIAIAHG